MLAAAWIAIEKFFSSPLFSSALVALLGAFFGAKTAQGTAERNRFRDEMVKEVRDTNAAISLSLSICSSLMAMKRQHLRSIKTIFARDHTDLLEYIHKRKLGQTQEPFQLQADLRGLPVPSLATDTLRAHVLDRLSVVGRPLNLAVSAAESSSALCQAIASRNEQLAAFKAAGGPNDKNFMARYFGLPNSEGQIDQIYSDTLGAIVLHTDCVIFFTYLLCSDLKTHGEKLVLKYKERLGDKGAPKVSAADFSKPKEEGLIPSDEEFSDWFTAFVKHPETTTRWVRMKLALRNRLAFWKS